MSSSDFGKGLLAFIGGAVVGATLGILFAPDKGSKTRKKIAEKSKDIRDSVTQRFEDIVNSAEEIVDELKEKAEKKQNK
jgi:gas vesicle protein